MVPECVREQRVFSGGWMAVQVEQVGGDNRRVCVCDFGCVMEGCLAYFGSFLTS